jgi:hypothetical protein
MNGQTESFAAVFAAAVLIPLLFSLSMPLVADASLSLQQFWLEFQNLKLELLHNGATASTRNNIERSVQNSMRTNDLKEMLHECHRVVAHWVTVALPP